MAGLGILRGKRRRQDRGAAAVEFALVLPILCMLLFGIISFGFGISDKVALVNAVREGARFGASTVNDANWGASVVARTEATYANAESPLLDSQVCALLWKQVSGVQSIVASSAASCESEPSALPVTDVPDKSCFLMVWAAKPKDLNWLVTSTTVTLSAQSVAVYDRGLSCP